MAADGAADEAEASLRAELRELDERIAELRREIEALPEDMKDPEDGAVAVRTFEEEEALLELLEARRAELLHQFGEG